MNSAALRKRIKSIRSTEQVTKAMKTVASSKYGRTQSLAESFRPYMERLDSIFAGLGITAAEEEKTTGSVCYVLITGNRGMCGQFNTAVTKLLEETLQEEKRRTKVIVCGRRGEDMLRRQGLEFESFPLPDIPDREKAEQLAERLERLRAGGEADEVCFIYGKYKNVLVQTPTREKLPLRDPEEAGDAPETGYIFSPGREELVSELYRLYIKARIYTVMLSAAESFHSAVMSAMRTAYDSSEEMLEQLEKELNRKRQGEITTEVLELSAGSASFAPVQYGRMNGVEHGKGFDN